jgi:hypothetical protein
MDTVAKPMRENRTIIVDVQHETTDVQLLGDGKAFLALVMAFILCLGFQLKHKATWRGGGCLDAPLAVRPCPPVGAHYCKPKNKYQRFVEFYTHEVVCKRLTPLVTRG